MVAALAAGGGSVAPAPAQCRLCDQPSTTRDGGSDADGLTLEIETNLNFDRLVLAAAGSGAAVVRPDGSNRVEGAVALMSARAMVGSAVVRGEPSRAVRVEMPRRIDLYSTSGGRISVDEVMTDLPALPKLDSAGKLSFRFGGRVTISGDAEGNYRGEMPITVEYQ
ncbi:MAG TPA: DUF4402 domain-containing protein [Sphingomicrobium sp.]|jgi:hypothetical protein